MIGSSYFSWDIPAKGAAKISKLGSERRVNFDPRGSYPKAEGKGATDRRASVERRLLKKLPAGVPRTAIYVDEHGRADMSWHNVPDNEKPPEGR